MSVKVSEITISDSAANRIREIRKEKQLSSDAMIRVSVESGGCSGLSYNLDFQGGEEMQQNDELYEDNGIKFIVDMRSFLYLAGTQLDYSEGLNGQGFHFHNPNASRTCSCGESFSL